MKYDYLIVGAGLYGATMAQKLTERGRRVLMIDRRYHIAGNAYTKEVEGVIVHNYGAHIFNTNSDEVWQYVQKFAEFNRFTNSPIANYHEEIYSLPFNMYTFNKMWGVNTPEKAMEYIAEQRKEIKGEPKNLEEQAISLVGRDIYEKLVKGYTEKQWGRKCTELPPSIIKRLPVRFTYDNNYFNAKYQGIPVDGYTRMVERMLEGVPVTFGVDYIESRERWREMADAVIYTGAIDEYFGYKLGKLDWRTVEFDTRVLDMPNYQGNAVVNYTDADTKYTRSIEHKWFNFGKDSEGKESKKTVVSWESSAEWTEGKEPYYPVNDERNNKLYAQYKELADKEQAVIFGGRLGEYKYYNMDEVIRSAFNKAKEL